MGFSSSTTSLVKLNKKKKRKLLNAIHEKDFCRSSALWEVIHFSHMRIVCFYRIKTLSDDIFFFIRLLH